MCGYAQRRDPEPEEATQLRAVAWASGSPCWLPEAWVWGEDLGTAGFHSSSRGSLPGPALGWVPEARRRLKARGTIRCTVKGFRWDAPG